MENTEAREWPWHVCEVCGRDYQRPKGFCPYCRRKAHWDKKPIEKQLPMLSPRLRAELLKCKTFPVATNEIRPMFVTGPVRTGKTLFAAKVIWDMLEQQAIEGIFVRVQFVSVPQLAEELKQCYQNKESDVALIKKYKDCDWLVLDDLGANGMPEWIYNVLFTIIDYRYEQLKPIIVTSNKDLEEIAEEIGDERLTRRIDAMAEVQYKFEKTY